MPTSIKVLTKAAQRKSTHVIGWPSSLIAQSLFIWTCLEPMTPRPVSQDVFCFSVNQLHNFLGNYSDATQASLTHFTGPWVSSLIHLAHHDAPNDLATDSQTQVSFAARNNRSSSLLTTESVSLTSALRTTQEMILLDFIIVSFCMVRPTIVLMAFHF